MVTIKTTKEIRLEDFTGVLSVEEIGSYLDYKWALVEEQKKVLNSFCHELGKPDHNGENYIEGVDGLHWKQFSEMIVNVLFVDE